MTEYSFSPTGEKFSLPDAEDYKREFEEAISSPPQNPERYLVGPKHSPWIRILRPEHLGKVRRKVQGFRDFTVHLPSGASNAVASARTYLSAQRARGGAE